MGEGRSHTLETNREAEAIMDFYIKVRDYIFNAGADIDAAKERADKLHGEVFVTYEAYQNQIMYMLDWLTANGQLHDYIKEGFLEEMETLGYVEVR